MKETTKRSFWIFWLPLGLAIAIFFLVTFVGNVLVIGSKLGFFSSSLEHGFYGFLLLVFIWLIVLPLFGVLAKPVLALDDIASGTSKADYKTLTKVAQQLMNAPALSKEQRDKLAGAVGNGSDLGKPLATAINEQRESAAKIIHSHAVRVFLATAVSQSGRLDTLAVLVTNFRLVRSLVNHFGYRPPLPTLIKIYAQIFLASLIADEIDDLDLAGGVEKIIESAFEIAQGAVSLLGGAASLATHGADGGAIGHIVASTLGSVTKPLVNPVLDGSINALFTLRVGFVTRKCLLNAGSSLTRSEIRKAANREARQTLLPVVTEAVPVLPSAIKSVFQSLF